MSKPKLGSGARFKALEKQINTTMNGKQYDPAAVAASIGRKKYGKEAFQKMAAKGRKNA